MRRDLRLETLDAVLEECESLMSTGYERHGNWSLGQMCNHMRLTMESNMHGYPAWMSILGLPLRPILRRVALPRLLRGNSIKGVKTAGMFVPSDALDDAEELRKFRECIHAFVSTTSPLHPHPGFGRMSHEEFERFHAAHSAHHLAFLTPADDGA